MVSTKNIVAAAIILAGAIFFFGLSKTDIWVQSHFYNPITHQWILDAHNDLLAFIFYDGIKRLLLMSAILFLLTLIIGWKKSWMRSYRQGVMIVVLSSVIVPLAVGSLKAVTNMPCPKSIETFGGTYPHTCVWEQYSDTQCHPKTQKCWPAGHASGGFALLSLIFLFHSRRHKILAGMVAMVIGWSMGMYKMLIGDHFLSHTVITMFLAWLIILMIARAIQHFFAENQSVV